MVGPKQQSQFEHEPVPFVYLAGSAMSCGDHPTLPKRHRWSRIKQFGKYRDRICVNCGLTKGADE